MKKILILGAGGFIGQHLSRHLIQINSATDIILFSRETDRLDLFQNEENVNIVKGDFNNLESLAPLVRDCDLVYHLISASVPATSWNNPMLEIEKNLGPTIKLLEICSKYNAKKVVFISSGGTIYGKQEGIVNEETLLSPFSPYGITKASIEYFLEYFRMKTHLNYDIYRMSNPYGPGLDKKGFGVINTWLKAAMNNDTIKVFGDGSASKDYVYIQDAIKLMDYSLKASLTTSNTFNICRGRSFSLNEILETIQNIVKENIDIEYIPSPQSDNKSVTLSNKKIRDENPNFAFISLEEGILKVWNSILEKKSI